MSFSMFVGRVVLPVCRLLIASALGYQTVRTGRLELPSFTTAPVHPDTNSKPKRNAGDGPKKVVAEGRSAEMPRYLTDRWLADCTLFGPAARVREGVEAWREAGITTPVIVPISPDGNQKRAIEAVFKAFE